MRKLFFMTTLLVIATACPKVERKVYSFDLATNSGVLQFENIVTDSPETANNDFMDVVNEVIRGTKIEEQHPGWNISKKEMFENEGRLDGKMEFSFRDARGAGIYKHDKKAPFIWCTDRDEEETIVSTNGIKIEELPGCVAWDRKQKQLTVTVQATTFQGGEQPLVEPFRKWSAGEELPLSDVTGMSGLESGLAGIGGAFASGIADAVAGDVDLTLGPPKTEGAGATDGTSLFGPMETGLAKMCLVGDGTNSALTETLNVTVQPDGTTTIEVTDSTAPSKERNECYDGIFKDNDRIPKRDSPWKVTFPVAITPK